MQTNRFLTYAFGMGMGAARGLALGPDRPSGDTSIEDVKRQIGESVRTLNEYGGAQRDEAYRKAQELSEDMNRRIDEMRARADELQGDAARQWQEAARDMERHRQRLDERLEAFRRDSGNAWDQMRDGFVGAYRELGDAFVRARRSFD